MDDLQAVKRLNAGGHVVLVDRDVYAWAKKIHWHLHKSDTRAYVAHNATIDYRTVRVFLHRVILGLGPDDHRRVDHINGSPFDNRRANLRIVLTAENAQNQGSRGGSSKHRGVSWDRSRGKWMASATLDSTGTRISGGLSVRSSA